MKVVTKIVRRIRRIEVPLFIVTAILGIYLAGSNIFRAAQYPDAGTWHPGTFWFDLLLAAAIWVPLYALYKAFDAYVEKREKKELERREQKTKLHRDLELSCREVVAAIADACPGQRVNDLAASVWLVLEGGRFKPLATFLLPKARPPTGVIWAEGKGVAGTALAIDQDLGMDLRPLQSKLEALGDGGFNALSETERLGMSAEEMRRAAAYTGVCASRLVRRSDDPATLGFLVVDSVGDGDFDCVIEACRRGPVRVLIGSIGGLLSEAESNL